MKITIQDARTSVTLQQRDFRVTISGARGPAGPAGPSEWGGIDGDIEEQTDLYNALQAKVPYTGATQDVNLGEYGAQLGNLEFDNTPTNVPTTAGSVYWNDTDGTLNLILKGGQTISRVGETQHIRALNNTGAQIARGKVVYVVGAQGQRLTIGLADADTEILSKDTIGFTAEAIADGAEGFVIVQGVINNVSTTGMTDGATVYLSQTAGSYTTTPPSDPAHLVVLGFIVNGGSGGAGSIYVKVDNGYELEELHNVSNSAKTTPVGDDALLLRDSADNNLWKRLTWTNALAGVKSHMDTFKSVAGGYASLDGSGKVPSSELPSYVDDVVEVANYAALPGTGETGKIYVTLDTNKCYRWTGSVYVQVAQGVDTLTTTGTSGAATLVGSTLNIPQYQGVLTNPVTGTGTAGQVAYFSGTSAVTGSNNLFWDAANGRLGIGTASPSIALQIEKSSNGSESIWIRNTNTGASAFGAVVAASYGVSPSTTGTIELRSHNFNHSVWPSTGMLLANSSLTNGLSIFATAGNITFNTTSGGNERARIESGGNFVIGTTSASARLHVRGSGTTSATTALLVQNSTPANLLTVTDDGRTAFGSSAFSVQVYPSGLNDNTLIGGDSLTFNVRANINSLTHGGVTFSGDTSAITSGNHNVVAITKPFSPTSGSAGFRYLSISPVINQTGGANGITRGLYVNPTLTAAADWRSVEFSNNTGWGLYGAGSANNYLAGALGIGATNITQYCIRIGKNITGGVNAFGVGIVATVQSDVTTTANVYYSTVGTAASSFTLNLLRHFHIDEAPFGLNSSVNNQRGFSVGTMSGATNNYGFYGDIASGTGRWNLYMNGTAANYLAGNTSIGTTTSSGRLTVQGSGTTSATKAFVVNNSTPTAIFEVLDNGRINQTIPGTSNNTIFGTSAGSSASLTGVNNSFFGVNAGLNNTTGVSNSFFGVNAGLNNTTGVSNSFFGVNSGINNTTGVLNSFFGVNAGRYLADGTTSLTVANQSVFVGGETRANADSQINQIVIGYQAIGNGSNTVTLGNTSITATYLRGNINYTDGGNFVIGTTTGTKIGTATNQLIGFFNATPVSQRQTTSGAATRVGGGGTALTDTDTFDGYTLATVVKALRDLGLLA